MKKKLRVAHIILEYHPIVGGAQRQLALLAPHLRAQQVENVVLTRRYPSLSAFERIDDVPVYRLPAPGPKAIASLLFTLAALWQLRRLQPDVLHAYSLFSPLTTAVVARRLIHAPVVVKVLRGGQLGDVQRMQARSSGPRRLESFRDQVAAFIAISQEIDAELASIGVPPARRPFIPNGVDTERFRPPDPAEKTHLRAELARQFMPGEQLTGPLAVYTGRLVSEKRLDLLISAWQTVRDRIPEAVLWIIGSGQQADRLRQAAGAGVYFTGRQEDVLSFLQAADLFVLPSATEGLSNALLEALSAGLACVVTAVGGAPDVITHRQDGWLVPPNDVQALEAGLLHLLDAPAERRQIGQAARACMVAEYALPTVAGRLRQLYEDALAGNPAAVVKPQVNEL